MMGAEVEKLHQKAGVAFSPLRVLAAEIFEGQSAAISYHLAQKWKFLVQSSLVLLCDLAHG